MTPATYTPEAQEHHGIGDGLVRLSVGLETPEGIEADLRLALAAD
jgi:methionine-gamma-lyase